ncbi:hypothetical protein EVAR_35753_1 [Eumeta japonica]|uniref:Uncharacterized protein n=1 Tax=Eumeta variegata TaxID=151549 RepID=A0A4C1VFC1_EUMVA|nr:hypothetical protein EVAR_35753_1 [Eumeta japonica]
MTCMLTSHRHPWTTSSPLSMACKKQPHLKMARKRVLSKHYTIVNCCAGRVNSSVTTLAETTITASDFSCFRKQCPLSTYQERRLPIDKFISSSSNDFTRPAEAMLRRDGGGYVRLGYSSTNVCPYSGKKYSAFRLVPTVMICL